ncbi:hypothetical protein A8F94_00395 [Bacillus sp. FJAT-27225]|uniref:hypothetical protein n=1 Tax=Bacillus sp. FJAT-27225 TaxID=1743144 RepID=UPI00080C2174|nr:hypothetical protein A8F94_00395 [Bacillus sp. FJAT-27225]
MDHTKKTLTSAGTDIEEAKRLNAQSGLSYNEVKEMLASTGGKGTAAFSNTDVEEVKRKIHPQHNEIKYVNTTWYRLQLVLHSKKRK